MKGNSLRWVYNCRQWTPTKNDLLRVLSCIQEDERDRIFKFVFKKSVKHALIGQLMLRKCVSDCLNINYDQVFFTRTEKGKPVLSGHDNVNQPFDYNISHDGDYCVLAADWIEKVGCDISRVRESNIGSTDTYFKTMERIFSPDEWLYIKNQSLIGKSSLHRFHRLWALKESFVKAEAVGIGYELTKIRFLCQTEYPQINHINKDTQIYLEGNLSNDWIFEESLIDDNHVVSVALSGDKSILTSKQSNGNLFKLIPLDDLVSSNTPVNVKEDLWHIYNSKEEGNYD